MVINMRAPDVKSGPCTTSLIITGCGKDLLREIVGRDAKNLYYTVKPTVDKTADVNPEQRSRIAMGVLR